MGAEELIKQLDRAFDKRRACDYSGALAEFESLETQSEHPADIAVLRLQQTTCLTDMGKPAEAVERIRTVDKNRLEPITQIDYEYEYARIMRAGKRPQIALEIARAALKAIQQDKENCKSIIATNLNTLVGILLAETERCDEAIVVLQNVPVDDLGWAEAQIKLGDCKYKKRLYREAISHYQSVVSRGTEVHPIFFDAALRNIGCGYYDLHEYSKAMEYLSLIEDKYEDHPALKSEVLELLSSAKSKLEQGKQSEAMITKKSKVV